MKILSFALVPVLAGLLLFSEPKVAVLSDGSKVSYSLSEGNQLNGAYLVNNAEGKLWLRGSFKDNQRVGNWYCFNTDGTLFLRYNYDTKKVVSVDPKSLSRIKFNILSKDSNAVSKATAPMPISSLDQYLSLFQDQISTIVKKEQKDLPNELPVDIVAELNAKGSVSYRLVYQHNGLQYSSKLSVREKMYDLAWSPATYENKIVPSEFIVSTKIISGLDKRQRFIWNY